ncbi:MAG: molybdopterin-dependent oxidoreductase [Chloroflexi bacterium]|nr:molybdopterin-dependent oxidoreductase [Chloroflexota bacterium]
MGIRVTRRTFVKATGAAAAGVVALHLLGGTKPIFRLLGRSEAQAGAEGERLVPSVCLQCPAGCGILVTTVNGRAVKIEGNPLHPINEGKLCPKGQSGLQFLYDPDRIRGPLKRVGPRGAEQWQQVSWEQAIAEVGDRLRQLRENGEAHKLVFLSGRNRGQMGGFIGRFLKAYGSPNDVGHSSICADGSPQAHYLTQGFKSYAGYDWFNTNYVLCFGGGFIEAWRPTTLLLRAHGHLRRGRPVRAKIVQVDTRFSISAAKADEWVSVKPGTDGALALGIAHVIIKEGLYDKQFVQEHTFGFEAWSDDKGEKHEGWKDLVLQKYSPEWASEVTGVPVETIVRIAREFATTRPAIAAGERGASMQTNGVYNRMAIHALNALVGSIDVPGGVLVQKGPPLSADPSVVQDEISKTGAGQPRIDYAGTKRYPMAGKVYQNIAEFATGQGPYEAKALLIYYTNPLFSVPDVARFHRAIEKIPFIVTFSPFMDETSHMADYILPDDTYLERWQDDVIYPSLGYPVVGLRQPVVTPLYDTMTTGDVLMRLAKNIGGTVNDSFPWESWLDYLKFKYKGVWEYSQKTGKGSIQAATFDDWWAEFRRRGVWADPPYTFGEWARVLPTDSKRFEFFSQKLEHTFEKLKMTETDIAALKLEARHDELFMPHYEPIRYAGDPQVYPLLLNTYKLMTHAEGRGANVPWLQELHGVHVGHKGTRWSTWVEVHPDTAAELGIHNGDEVWVESQVGRIKTVALLFPGARRDVVNIPFENGHTSYGRWAKERGANPNWVLVNEADILGGLAAFFSTRVRIYKA